MTWPLSETLRFRRHRPVAVVVVAAAIMLPGVLVPRVSSAAPVIRPADARVEQAPAPATRLQPVAPCRVFDTRLDSNSGRLDSTTWRVQLAGRCGVPDDARAVAISLVATNVGGQGFLSVWPSGSPRPDVSNLNFERMNTIANSAVVQLGQSGSVDVFSWAPADIVIDVTGAFVDAPSGATAGRFVPADPVRVLDTRLSGQRGTSELRVPLPAGVPADATAVAVNLTAVDAADVGFAGYLTAYPAGGIRPDTSVLNTDRHNPTRANTVFLPVTADGFVIFRYMPTDVLVDFWGWFTGPSAASSTEGLFVPQAPVRVWDSRASNDPLHADGTLERAIAPPGTAAIVANVTAVDSVDSGFVTVHPAGVPRPVVSSLNARWRAPVAALTVARASTRGVSFYSSAGAHILVDVAGAFLGDPVAAPLPPPANAFPAPDTSVVMVSDSSFAGIRWNGALGFLQGAAWDARLESCRRLIGASCSGREGYAPRTAVAELSTLPYGYEVAVIVTGYNDYASMFPSGLDAVIKTARAKGIERVVWLTYREDVGYVSPSRISYAATFASNNRTIAAAVASGDYPELIVADWNLYTAGSAGWLTADGVHLTVSGARAGAEYASRKLAALERRPCPPAIGGASAPGGWCADPDLTGRP